MALMEGARRFRVLGEDTLLLEVGSVLNTEPDPSTVAYRQRWFSPSHDEGDENAAVYCRIDHRPGETDFRYGIYAEITGQSLAGGSFLKVMHRGAGDAQYIALLGNGPSGYGQKVAMFGGWQDPEETIPKQENGFLASLQGSGPFGESVKNQSNSIGYHVLVHDDGTDPTDEEEWCHNHGLFFANNTLGKSFVARVSEYALNRPIFQIHDHTPEKRSRWEVYAEGEMYFRALEATAEAPDRAAPRIAQFSSYWDGEAEQAYGFVSQPIIAGAPTPTPAQSFAFWHIVDGELVGADTVAIVTPSWWDFQGKALVQASSVTLQAGTGVGLDMQGKQILGAGSVSSDQFVVTGGARAFRGEDVVGNVAAPTVVFQGTNAAWNATSEVNTSTFVMSGIPTNRLTVVNYANISEGFQFQLLVRRLNNNGTAETITFTAGTHFTVETSNAQTASNIAEAVNGVTGPVDGPVAIATGDVVRLLPSPNTINCSFWVASGQSSAWTYAQGTRTLNIGVGFPGTVAGAGTINIGVNGDILNFGANIGNTNHTGTVGFGGTSSVNVRMVQPTPNVWTLSHVTNVKESLSPAGIAHTVSTVTLGAAATTFAVASNVVSITGNGGGNEVTTATLNTPAVANTYTTGLRVTLVFQDANVTMKTTPYASRAADEMFLKGGDYVSSAGGTLTLMRDDTGWVEVART